MLGVIVIVMLFTMLLDFLKEPFERLFPKTASRLAVRRHRIELEHLEQQNRLLEEKKLAIEKQKALEDFLSENRGRWE